ncbi:MULTISPECIES: hypothetical protein [Olivibacter]|uniref:Uncharacterized protein n=1 Tax=Olivibacter oleidegradans TaxID=760123 RepID=A0ABV6HIJ4_9SPHI|nr:hypothetical protein [Olivibacter jilunii]
MMKIYARSNQLACPEDLHALIDEMLVSEGYRENFTSYKQALQQYFSSLENTDSDMIFHGAPRRYILVDKYQSSMTNILEKWWTRLNKEKLNENGTFDL